LVIAGGGRLGADVLDRFIELAGGRDSAFVVIPTAGISARPLRPEETFLAKAGCKDIVILDTEDRTVAESESFVEPLRRARAVWIHGGREWRLVHAYLNTRVQRELNALLDRGGVIGGSSAGASVQASFLVRGHPERNDIIVAPEAEQGFGFMRGVAIDQHLLARKRENDLLQVIDAHPEILGIGLDEGTAIIVRGDQFEVMGPSKVAIYDSTFEPPPGGKRFYFLQRGQRFDLKTRRVQ
jgi:cyanophycinase